MAAETFKLSTEKLHDKLVGKENFLVWRLNWTDILESRILQKTIMSPSTTTYQMELLQMVEADTTDLRSQNFESSS